MSNLPVGVTTQPAEPQAPEAQAQPTLADVISAVKTLTEVTNERLKTVGQDVSRLREKFKLPAASADDVQGGAPQAQQAQPTALSVADLNAALALGEIRGKLPELAKARIASMLEQGRSYSDALAFAEALAESLSSGAAIAPSSANGQAAMAQPFPTGRAAMAAQSPVVGHPRTQTELYALAKSNPDKYRAVMADPTFDSINLPFR